MYACKRILGLSSQSPNHMVYGELGRHRLSVLASTRCVKYWLRLNTLSSNRSVRTAYNMLKTRQKKVKKTGPQRFETYCVRMVSPLLGGMNQWETKHVSWLNSGQRLKDCFIQNWHSRLESSGRYEVYRTFKSVLEKEKYLEVIQNLLLQHHPQQQNPQPHTHPSNARDDSASSTSSKGNERKKETKNNNKKQQQQQQKNQQKKNKTKKKQTKKHQQQNNTKTKQDKAKRRNEKQTHRKPWYE